MYLTVQGYFEEAFADGQVLSGCFSGMPYVTESICSAHSPKLLGTYEKELYAIIEAVPTASYSTIVNVGAGECYYAVGLARQNPGVPVIVFDLDPVKVTSSQPVRHSISGIMRRPQPGARNRAS